MCLVLFKRTTEVPQMGSIYIYVYIVHHFGIKLLNSYIFILRDSSTRDLKAICFIFSLCGLTFLQIPPVLWRRAWHCWRRRSMTWPSFTCALSVLPPTPSAHVLSRSLQERRLWRVGAARRPLAPRITFSSLCLLCTASQPTGSAGKMSFKHEFCK